MDMAALRAEVVALVGQAPDDDGAWVRAADLLAEADLEGLPEFRLAVLRSFTIEPLVEVLRVKAFLEGLRLKLFLGEFNQYQQEILDPGSRFYGFKPEAAFIAVRLEDLCPRLFHDFARLGPEEVQAVRAEVQRSLESWVEAIDRHGPTNVLLSNFLVPGIGALGLADGQSALGQVPLVRALNLDLVGLAARHPRLYVFDLELLAGRIGKATFCDPVQLYRTLNPYRLSVYPEYGEWLMAHLRALLGRQRKCLVLDLDGTLWGGTVGEDGPAGLELDDAYPGNCFKDFQRSILRLQQRGVLLAVNSKNNPEDALEVIRTHPHMLLREEHFSAIRINWKDKVENLHDIGRELNIGLDALVFVDDSPAECERVRRGCPEVLVVQLPLDRHLYPCFLERLTCFEQLTLTAEDRTRVELYRSRALRELLAAESATLEDFFASLEMRGTIYRNEPSQIARIAQMTQKTNQFNLTTRRYTEADIARFLPEALVYTFRVEDRFGDNGIIAVAIVVPRATGEWYIDTLLMSCRVIMRTIEDTLLAQIAEDARAGGARRLVGAYIPTSKNEMVKDFYPQRGFTARDRAAPGEIQYVLDLDAGGSPAPSRWVRLLAAAPTVP